MSALGRVWITGVAALTAAGEGASALGDAVVAGRALTRPSEHGPWSVATLPFDPAATLPELLRRDLDRVGAMLVAAALGAWRDAGLAPAIPPDEDPARTGIVSASAVGAVAAQLDAYARWTAGRPASPRDIVRTAPGLAAAIAANALGALGPAIHLSCGSVSGATALGDAWMRVATGQLDRCLAVASESPIHRAVLTQFAATRILAEGGPDALKPFSPNRCGTQLGEGAAALLLESDAAVRARGATVRGAVLGYGAAADGGAHTVAPDPDGHGAIRAARAALRAAGLGVDEVDLVLLHGTGTTLNDAAEARAYGALFGGCASPPPAAATKPITGHCLGACGALESVIALACLARGVVPPTANLDAVDPALAVPVAAHARSVAARTALVLSAGFGGRNAALLLARA
ncbi:MAG: beta-ketoacyl synthase N-terminal-like domain-containing protein [Polyangiales bacterium]